MQENYRQNILRQVEVLKATNWTEVFAVRYPNQADLSAVQFGPHTGSSFIANTKQLAESLEAAMNSAQWQSLSASSQHHNEFGQVDINQTLNQFVQHVKQNQVEQAAQHLDRCIWYAMSSGIWLKDGERQAPSRTQVKWLADQLEEAGKRLAKQLDMLEKQGEELNARKQDLVQFTEEKKNELGDVRRAADEAQKTIKAMADLLAQAQKNDEGIDSVKEKAQALVNELNVQLGVITKGFDAFKEGSDKQKADLAQMLTEAKEHLDKSDAQYETILGYRETIEKYLGYSVDGYLGNKFDDRAEKLRKALRFWQLAVPISVVVSIAWVAIVFTWLRSDLGNEWVNLGINLLKTTPAFILMGFTFGQYGKERNLQEEYAFKSAVAMTINAYANLLAEKDSDVNKSRQQLILRALEEVHKQPKLYSEKGGTMISLKAREMRETMSTLNETLNNLKG